MTTNRTTLKRTGSGSSEEEEDQRREPSFKEDNAILSAPQFSKYVEYYNDLKAVPEEVDNANKEKAKENTEENDLKKKKPESLQQEKENPKSNEGRKLHKTAEYDPQENEPNITLVVSQMTQDGIDANEIRRFAQALRAQEYYSHMFTSRSRSASHSQRSFSGNEKPNEYFFDPNQPPADSTMIFHQTSSIPDMRKLIEASNNSLASMDSQNSFEEFFRVNLDERTPSVVMKSVFNFYDDDKDGVLSSKNFKRLLFKMGIRESELRHFMMILADKDENNQISWNDFYAWVKKDQAQRWIRENDRFFTFVMIAKIFMKKHEKRKEKIRSQQLLQVQSQSQSQLSSSSSSENIQVEEEQKKEEENNTQKEEKEENLSDQEDEKSDKPIAKKSSDKLKSETSKNGTNENIKKISSSDLKMDSSFMEEGIERGEFLEIGQELGFHETHLQMLWEQINDFQSNEVHFHQWFQYLEPIDITENNPKDNPNLSSVTGIKPNKDKTPSQTQNTGSKRPPKNDQV